uniref:Transcriptional regulator n=1 Tax=Thermofilum pendens TaxID=2269 RepID=A0A7C3SP31_THEPE
MSEIPLKPMGKEDIRKLELALILGTLLRPDVLEAIRTAEDKLTWLDSLIVAAGALARERAGYSLGKIAEELGRTEATIRNHLTGKTEAGRLVRGTYDNLVKSGGKLEVGFQLAESEEVERLRAKVSELEEKLKKTKEVLSSLLQSL